MFMARLKRLAYANKIKNIPDVFFIYYSNFNGYKTSSKKEAVFRNFPVVIFVIFEQSVGGLTFCKSRTTVLQTIA